MPLKDIRYVACSGGVDSMALLSFILNKTRDISVVFFDHNTPTSREAERFVLQYCLTNGIHMATGRSLAMPPKGDSKEDFWRRKRYEFLHSFPGKVATAHHLDDVAETYLFGCIHGQPKFIGREYHNVVRPLLLTPKSELISWCQRTGTPHIEDKTNTDTRFNRNRIRHNIMPEVFQVNPGFLKVIKRLQEEKWATDETL